MASASERRKSQENSVIPVNVIEQHKKTSIVYRPFPNIYNSSQNSQHRTEIREEEFSDGFSESTSLNSDLFDPNKIKDIIETSDQGIQSQSNLPLSKDNDGSGNVVAIQTSPSENVISSKKNHEERKKEDSKQKKYEQEVIKKSEILRAENEEYGFDFSNKKIGETSQNI